MFFCFFEHSKYIEIFTIKTNNLNKEERNELYFLNHSLNRKDIDVRHHFIGVFSSLKKLTIIIRLVHVQ